MGSSFFRRTAAYHEAFAPLSRAMKRVADGLHGKWEEKLSENKTKVEEYSVKVGELRELSVELKKKEIAVVKKYPEAVKNFRVSINEGLDFIQKKL